MSFLGLTLHVTVSILISLDITGVQPQQTLSDIGCSFFDDEDHVYKVGISPGLHDLPCDTLQRAKLLAADNQKKVDETSQTLSVLAGLLDRQLQSSRELFSAKSRVVKTLTDLGLPHSVLGQCPPQYELRSEEYESCYLFVGRYLAWYDAQAFCMSNGGNLVALETDEEQEFLVDYIQTSNVLPGKHMWTGGNDIGLEDKWMWAGINKPFNFTRWLTYPHVEHGTIQMPDDYKEMEHCVHLFHLHNYDWNDLYCGHLHYFICEYKLS